jgi:predicted NBD/HSP70 family sugar kinase
MFDFVSHAKPRVVPPLDPEFRPLVLANDMYLKHVVAGGKVLPLVIGLEREEGSVSVYETVVSSDPRDSQANLCFAERMVKTLLWMRGGWRVIIGGPEEIGNHIKTVYAPGGKRAFDAEFMGDVYEHQFTVDVMDVSSVPSANEKAAPLGRHLKGCRIGFDLGASDRKVAAVIDGKTIFSEEVVWEPRINEDPSYHYDQIMTALKKAASKLPKVDAIGGSSAGIYINNRVRVASLFRAVPKALFDSQVRDMFINMREEWDGVPFDVVNDGDVTALAGAMSLNDNSVLGIALGSSEAGGYVTPEGSITGWLNELAFAPVDVSPKAPTDEWSGDAGVGALYFSQQAVFRLAERAGIELKKGISDADKLKSVQEVLIEGDGRAQRIWDTIGVYLGYGIAHYADYYDINHILILGRVTSYEGGAILLENANLVLSTEFPELLERTKLHLPDESTRRVGQAVAAASLPSVDV